MPDSFENRADELFESAGALADTLRRTIEPADRFGESLVALTTDLQSLTGRPPITPPAVANPGFSQLGELFAETATRDGQQEQLKLIGEQLAEQKRTNDHLQAIAEKDSPDVLGP
ncbi:hypothetical protein ES707_09508 [subsurface metagenome]